MLVYNDWELSSFVRSADVFALSPGQGAVIDTIEIPLEGQKSIADLYETKRYSDGIYLES